MKKHRVSLLGLCLGLILMLGLGVPAIVAAADASPIVGNWEGSLDPGAQPKSDFWCTFPRHRTEV